MFEKFIQVVTWLSVGGAALSSGVFFTFSAFVMPSLDRLTASQAVTSMQEINKYAPGPGFGLALVGTSVTSVILAGSVLLRWDQPGNVALLTGAALFIVGGILVTGFGNIPLNNQLADLNPNQADIATQWSDFLGKWQAWNHVRTGLTFAATICYVIALRQAAAD